MYVGVHHRINDPATAFPRGERLIKGEGAPAGARALQFYPSADQSTVLCLWEADSVESVQNYVDETLGDASENACFAIDSEQAFAEQPLGLRTSAGVGA